MNRLAASPPTIRLPFVTRRLSWSWGSPRAHHVVQGGPARAQPTTPTTTRKPVLAACGRSRKTRLRMGACSRSIVYRLPEPRRTFEPRALYASRGKNVYEFCNFSDAGSSSSWLPSYHQATISKSHRSWLISLLSISRPYAISSKTNWEFPLTERKSNSYRRVKLLFLFPLAQGGFYPSHWSVATGVRFPRTSPSGESLP